MKIIIEMEIDNQYEDDPDNEDHDGVQEMHDEFRRQMEYIISSVIDEGVGTMDLYDVRTNRMIGTSKLEDY